jgi:adenosine deaminase
MTTSPFAGLPKVELHSHMDCCLSFRAARRIDPALTAADYDRRFVAPPRCDSLADYLVHTLPYRAMLQTEPALRIAVEDVFDQMAADGVAYAELRFAPLAQREGGLTGEQVVEAVADEVVAQVARTGVEATVILCSLRQFSAEDSLATAALVERYAGEGPVVALDLAGDEAGHPLERHLPAFLRVRAAGLPITVHAGESAGPANVWEALERTGTRRIGHGIRSVEDPALVAHLRDEGVHLEVCPSSNVQTSAVASLAAHPVADLVRAGVSLGISTDTRAVTDVTVTDEYDRLAATFGWSVADFRRANEEALAASFAPPDVRARVAARLAAAYDAASGTAGPPHSPTA